MADFDYQALLQNPLFLGGVSALLAAPDDKAKALLGGLQTGKALQASDQQQQMNALRLKAMQAQQDFDPTAYMKTAPVAQGMAAPNAWAAQQANQMPATLGGPIGGQTQMPAAPTAGVNAQLTPEPGTPTGRIDVPGLLAGGMNAGLTPQAISAIGTMLDPQTAAEQAAAAKMAEPYTLAPGQSRMVGNQVIGQNTNPPPGGVAQQIMTLTQQRDALPPGPLRDSLDMAIKKTSGELDAMQSQRNFEANQTQREVQNGFREQGQKQQHDQFTQNQVTKFSNQLQKTGLPQAQQQLDTIDGILQKHAGTKDEVPGYGRVEGAIPGMFLSGDAQELRQAVQSLANVVLKTRSGAAVTEPEQKRFIIELGSGAWMPQERLLQGLKMMRGLVDSEKANAAAGVSNDVIDAYGSTPGAMDFSQYRKPDTGNSGGGVSIGNASAADIAAAIARKKGAK